MFANINYLVFPIQIMITKLQKRTARIILDAPFFTHTQHLFDSLNWLPSRDRISYHKLILVYKILNNKAPDYLKKLCIPSSENHSRNLRSGSFIMQQIGVLIIVLYII
jgi:hypothetical protein